MNYLFLTCEAVWSCCAQSATKDIGVFLRSGTIRNGMSLAEKSIPDLILMDMRMPHLDGLSVTRLIRFHPTLNEVPIIAVTGMVTPQFRSEVLSAGCNDCLYKPIDFDRLEQLIKTLTSSVPRHNLSSHSVITGQTW